ncbi:MAG: TIGR02281 family clan AA aspartic protease [Rhodobacterales bacterium]|nr:TIGR02281 family clan AA aspartic protease [Rhodobacterales bacterium]
MGWAIKVASVLLLAAVGVYLMVDGGMGLSGGGGAHPGAGPDSPARPAGGGAREVRLKAGAGGHFRATVRVDDADLPFLIDTGATAIVLEPDAAEAAGLHVRPSDFTIPVGTAGGQRHAARVRLREVKLGPIVVRDVDALVMDGPMGINLLGLAFLKRLEGYAVSGDSLVLSY